MLTIDRLIRRIDEKACPIVVGLDPLIQFIPYHIKQQALLEYGNTKKAAAEAIFRFNQELLEATHLLIPAVKLQMACYELYGAEGVDVFHKTALLASSYDLTVIDDSKRNDIGSTAQLYALGHLGNPPLIKGEIVLNQPDFLTINPYIGSDTIDPFINECHNHNKGVFVLVRTSNPSAKEYQEAQIDNKPLYERIACDLNVKAQELVGKSGFSSIGAVVGATWPDETIRLRAILPKSYFLVPGYGAQGGTADQVVAAFDGTGYGALINSSRSIIFAYRKASNGQEMNSKQFAQISKTAIREMRNDILSSLKKAKKLPRNW